MENRMQINDKINRKFIHFDGKSTTNQFFSKNSNNNNNNLPLIRFSKRKFGIFRSFRSFVIISLKTKRFHLQQIQLLPVSRGQHGKRFLEEKLRKSGRKIGWKIGQRITLRSLFVYLMRFMEQTNNSRHQNHLKMSETKKPSVLLFCPDFPHHPHPHPHPSSYLLLFHNQHQLYSKSR